VEEVAAVMLVVVVVLVVPETAEDEEMRRLAAPLGAGEALAKSFDARRIRAALTAAT
jgi:hypothetical protein